jgi:hypothetical protein
LLGKQYSKRVDRTTATIRPDGSEDSKTYGIVSLSCLFWLVVLLNSKIHAAAQYLAAADIDP